MVTYLSDDLTIQLNRLMSTLDVDLKVKLRARRGKSRYVIVSLNNNVNMDWRDYSSFIEELPSSIFDTASDVLHVKTTAKLLDSPENVKQAMLIARKMDMENKKWQKI